MVDREAMLVSLIAAVFRAAARRVVDKDGATYCELVDEGEARRLLEELRGVADNCRVVHRRDGGEVQYLRARGRNVSFLFRECRRTLVRFSV